MGRPPFPLGRLQAWQDLGPFLIERFQPADACQIFRGQQGRVASLGIRLCRHRGRLTDGCIGCGNRRGIDSRVAGSGGVRCIGGRIGRSLGKSFFKDIGMDEGREACIRKTAFHKTSTRFTIRREDRQPTVPSRPAPTAHARTDRRSAHPARGKLPACQRMRTVRANSRRSPLAPMATSCNYRRTHRNPTRNHAKTPENECRPNAMTTSGHNAPVPCSCRPTEVPRTRWPGLPERCPAPP